MHKRDPESRPFNSRRNEADAAGCLKKSTSSFRREPSPSRWRTGLGSPRRAGFKKQLPPGFSASLKPRLHDSQVEWLRETPKNTQVKKEAECIGLPPHLLKSKTSDAPLPFAEVGTKRKEIVLPSEPVHRAKPIVNGLLAEIGKASQPCSQLYLARGLQNGSCERLSRAKSSSSTPSNAETGKMLFNTTMGSCVHEKMGAGSNRYGRRRSPTPVFSPTEVSHFMSGRDSILGSPGPLPTRTQEDHPPKKQKTRGPDMIEERRDTQGNSPITTDAHDLTCPQDSLTRNLSLPKHNGPESPTDSFGSKRAGDILPILTRRPQVSDLYIAELRLLLAERMHEALESSIVKGQGDCGILEESIGFDYNGRFGRVLNFQEAGFPTLKEMIRSTCLDIVQMQKLRAGDMVKLGLIPTPSFKAESRRVFADVRSAYSNLVLKHGTHLRPPGDGSEFGNCVGIPSEELDMPKHTSNLQCETQYSAGMLEIMAKNMLESLVRDITVGVWPSVTVAQFLRRFFNHYSVSLEARQLGFKSIEDFLSSQARDLVKTEVIGGVVHLYPSNEYAEKKATDPKAMQAPNLISAAHNVPAGQQVTQCSKPLVAAKQDQTETAALTTSDMQEQQMPETKEGKEREGDGDCPRASTQTPALPIGQEEGTKHGNPTLPPGKACNRTHHTDGDGAGNDCDSANTMPIFPQTNPGMDAGMRAAASVHNTGIHRQTTPGAEQNSSPQLGHKSTGQPVNARAEKPTGLKDQTPAFIALSGSGSMHWEANQSKYAHGNGNGSSELGHACTSSSAGHSHPNQIPGNQAVKEKGSGRKHDEAMPSSRCFHHLPTALAKVRALLENVLTGPSTSLLLSKLPLLYFNKYNHVLDYIGFGFKNLTEMVNLLHDIVVVTDTPAGKLLVPTKKAQMSMAVGSVVANALAQKSPKEHQRVIGGGHQACRITPSGPLVEELILQDEEVDLSHQNPPLSVTIKGSSSKLHLNTNSTRPGVPLKATSRHVPN